MTLFKNKILLFVVLYNTIIFNLICYIYNSTLCATKQICMQLNSSFYGYNLKMCNYLFSDYIIIV